MTNDFAPWWENYRDSCWILIFSISIGWILMLLNYPIAAFSICLPGSCLSIWVFLKGRKRENGIKVELESVAKLSNRAPIGYKGGAGPMISRYENVDAIVTPPTGCNKFSIEIKSFKGMTKTDDGKLTKIDSGYHLRNEIRQVRRQCYSLGSETHLPVLWCPIAEINSYFPHEEILVVNGDVETLYHALSRHHDLVSLPVLVSFKEIPPKSYRDSLIDMGFKWIPRKLVWHGYATVNGVADLNSKICHVNGSASLRRRNY